MVREQNLVCCVILAVEGKLDWDHCRGGHPRSSTEHLMRDRSRKMACIDGGAPESAEIVRSIGQHCSQDANHGSTKDRPTGRAETRGDGAPIHCEVQVRRGEFLTVQSDLESVHTYWHGVGKSAGELLRSNDLERSINNGRVESASVHRSSSKVATPNSNPSPAEDGS